METESISKGQKSADGCQHCMMHKEHIYWDHQDAKGKYFYCLMEGSDFSRRMIIPKKFITNFKGKLSKVVHLKGPSGNIWHVELKTTVDRAILQSGWKNFVEAHRIEENDILVFRYDGNSCFDIVMFDESNCEKEASYFVKSSSSRKGCSEDSVEALHVAPSCKVNLSGSSRDSTDDIQQEIPPSTRRISRGDHKLMKKIQRATLNCRKESVKRNKHSVIAKNKHVIIAKNMRGRPRKNVGISDGTRFHSKQEFPGMHKCQKLAHQNVFVANKKELTSEQEEKALQMAQAIHPNNPCLLSIINPSIVRRRYFLAFPTAFAGYLPPQSSSIFLEVLGQRKKWVVSYIVGKLVSGISGGWRQFSLENNLAEGDICLFELTTHDEATVLTVNITRAADYWH